MDMCCCAFACHLHRCTHSSMFALRAQSIRGRALAFFSTASNSAAAAAPKRDLTLEIQAAIKEAQTSKTGAITKVRQLFAKEAPPAPSAAELAARRKAARELNAAKTRSPQPVQGPRRPYHLRPALNAEAGQTWPAPHPNWYKYPTQKVFRSALKKRENHGPLTYPEYEMPRLREAAPRSHLLDEQQLIRDALPNGGVEGAPLRLPPSANKRGVFKRD